MPAALRWRDGTTHVIYEPLELLERLAALVPPPRMDKRDKLPCGFCLAQYEPSHRVRIRGDM